MKEGQKRQWTDLRKCFVEKRFSGTETASNCWMRLPRTTGENGIIACANQNCSPFKSRTAIVRESKQKELKSHHRLCSAQVLIYLFHHLYLIWKGTCVFQTDWFPRYVIICSHGRQKTAMINNHVTRLKRGKPNELDKAFLQKTIWVIWKESMN